jgi:hypothetical protein
MAQHEINESERFQGEPHPPPASSLHPSTQAILQYFDFGHLPPQLAAVSGDFCSLAHSMAHQLSGPELTAGLRKLLEAKDCMVRAALTGSDPGVARQE